MHKVEAGFKEMDSYRKQLLQGFINGLSSFKTSGQPFRVVWSHDISFSRADSRLLKDDTPGTLFILDSSYNPPSLAHLTIAKRAVLGRHLELAPHSYPRPYRLLLLLATNNADKPTKPATFEHRLCMMASMAEDLMNETTSNDASDVVRIDVGVTTLPYYVDKSQAIQNSQTYLADMKHVHILGFDTITRLLTPKYYPQHDPPLSALKPYFDAKHRFLVALRPTAPEEGELGAIGQTLQQQRDWISALDKGKLNSYGFEHDWASQVDILENEDAIENTMGVSSSAARSSIDAKNWEDVKRLCSPGVTSWIRDAGPYDVSTS